MNDHDDLNDANPATDEPSSSHDEAQLPDETDTKWHKRLLASIVQDSRTLPITALVAVAALGLSLFQAFWSTSYDQKKFEDMYLNSAIHNESLALIFAHESQGMVPQHLTVIADFMANNEDSGVVERQEISFELETGAPTKIDGAPVVKYPAFIANLCDRAIGKPKCPNVDWLSIRIIAEYARGEKRTNLPLDSLDEGKDSV